MAKKFGKFLLFGVAACATAASIYYYLQKKESDNFDDEDIDGFDDFDDFDDAHDCEDRTYVSLTPAAQSASEKDNDDDTQTKQSTTNDNTTSNLQTVEPEPSFTEDYFDDNEYVDDITTAIDSE